MSEKSFWDKFLEKEYQNSGFDDGELKEPVILQEILKCIDKNFGNRKITFLEAGCGFGIINFWLYKKNKTRASVGVDFSDALRYAKEYALSKKMNIYFCKADIQNLPFEDDKFDFITSLGVIEHFSDPISVLQEMKRILKVGGVLFLETPNKGLLSLQHKLFGFSEHHDYYNWQDLSKLGEQVGFKMIEGYGYNFAFSITNFLGSIYQYSQTSIICRIYHRFLLYFKKILVIFNSLLDKKFGFFSIVILLKAYKGKEGG